MPSHARGSEADIASKTPRVNEQIDVPVVRLVDDEGKYHNQMALHEALAMAKARGLDLVEVNPKTHPVICKLLDYGQELYQKKKQRKDAKTKSRQSQTKVIKLRPNTSRGDRQTKMAMARRFLEAGDKVRLVMQFRGRENIYVDNGVETFRGIATDLSDIAEVDSAPSSEGRFLNMTLSPTAAQRRARAAKDAAAAKAAAAAQDDGTPGN